MDRLLELINSLIDESLEREDIVIGTPSATSNHTSNTVVSIRPALNSIKYFKRDFYYNRISLDNFSLGEYAITDGTHQYKDLLEIVNRTPILNYFLFEGTDVRSYQGFVRIEDIVDNSITFLPGEQRVFKIPANPASYFFTGALTLTRVPV